MATATQTRRFGFIDAVGLAVPLGLAFQIFFPVDPFGVLLAIVWAIAGGSIAALMLFVSICCVKQGIPWLKFILLGVNVLLAVFMANSLLGP